MSLYGVWQLLRLRVVYCSRGGSSRGARDFAGNYLPKFRKENPQIDIVEEERVGHPFLQATYRNDVVKDVEVQNLDAPKIFHHVRLLRDSHGRSTLTKTLKRHSTSRRSLQGRWTPKLFDSR